MKKILINTLIFSLLISVVACKKNNEVIDQSPLTAPARSHIAYEPQYAAARDFYVENVPGGNVYSIPIGITNVSNVDRTVQIAYTSTNAVNGTHFTAPTTLVIKAGMALDTLKVIGNFPNIVTGTAYVVKCKITGGDVPSMLGKDSVVLTMRRFCPVELTALEGDYTKTYEGTYGPYTSNISNVALVPGSTTKATAKVSNIYDSGIEANVTFDWTSKSAFSVTLTPASQATPYTSGGLPLMLRLAPNTTSTFSSCEKTVTLRLQLYTTAGVYDTFTMSMAK